MKKQNLGKSSFQISPLCLGLSMGHNDFSEQGQQQFKQLINRALDLGLNFLDSSDAYWDGLHETWLGAAIGNRRDEAVITSKFGNLTLPDGKKATDARPEYVVSCCHDSLKRLNVDCIDLYYLHRVDPKVPIEDTVGAMSRMVEQGKVRLSAFAKRVHKHWNVRIAFMLLLHCKPNFHCGVASPINISSIHADAWILRLWVILL